MSATTVYLVAVAGFCAFWKVAEQLHINNLAIRPELRGHADLDATQMWEKALEVEPFPQIWIAGERVDTAFIAIAAPVRHWKRSPSSHQASSADIGT